MDYIKMKELATRFEVPIAEMWCGIFQDSLQLIHSLKRFKGCEGFVIRFKDGEIMKLHTLWYLNRLRRLSKQSQHSD